MPLVEQQGTLLVHIGPDPEAWNQSCHIYVELMFVLAVLLLIAVTVYRTLYRSMKDMRCHTPSRCVDGIISFFCLAIRETLKLYKP